MERETVKSGMILLNVWYAKGEDITQEIRVLNSYNYSMLPAAYQKTVDYFSVHAETWLGMWVCNKTKGKEAQQIYQKNWYCIRPKRLNPK